MSTIMDNVCHTYQPFIVCCSTPSTESRVEFIELTEFIEFTESTELPYFAGKLSEVFSAQNWNFVLTSTNPQ